MDLSVGRVDRLIARIRKEVTEAQARDRGAVPRPFGDNGDRPIELPACPAWEPAPAPDLSVHAVELLARSNADFVAKLYRMVLGREPDPEGFEHYCTALDEGTSEPWEVVEVVASSPEARLRGVSVVGIDVFRRLVKVQRLLPPLGRVIAAGVRLLQPSELPQRVHRLALANEAANARLLAMADYCEALRTGTERLLTEARTDLQRKANVQELENLRSTLDVLGWKVPQGVAAGTSESRSADAVQALPRRGPISAFYEPVGVASPLRAYELAERLSECADDRVLAAAWERIGRIRSERRESLLATRDELSVALATIEAELADEAQPGGDLDSSPNNRELQSQRELRLLEAQLVDARIEALDQDRRIHELEREARTNEEQAEDNRRLRTVLERSLRDDGAIFSPDRAELSASFLDRFRGSEAEIRSRLTQYMEFLDGTNAGRDGLPVLDLGAGRGEWLALLAERGLKARGVDLNPVLVEELAKRNIDAACGDALQFLRSTESGSFGAVTAFHLIEHVPPTYLLGLIEEAHRVLAPAGLLILETPNAENVYVGASYFHLDPSHYRPVLPAYLEFLVAHCGFELVESLRPTCGRPEPPVISLPIQDGAQGEALGELSAAWTRFFGPGFDYGLVARKPAADTEGAA